MMSECQIARAACFRSRSWKKLCISPIEVSGAETGADHRFVYWVVSVIMLDLFGFDYEWQTVAVPASFCALSQDVVRFDLRQWNMFFSTLRVVVVNHGKSHTYMTSKAWLANSVRHIIYIAFSLLYVIIKTSEWFGHGALHHMSHHSPPSDCSIAEGWYSISASTARRIMKINCFLVGDSDIHEINKFFFFTDWDVDAFLMIFSQQLGREGGLLYVQWPETSWTFQKGGLHNLLKTNARNLNLNRSQKLGCK